MKDVESRRYSVVSGGAGGTCCLHVWGDGEERHALRQLCCTCASCVARRRTAQFTEKTAAERCHVVRALFCFNATQQTLLGVEIVLPVGAETHREDGWHYGAPTLAIGRSADRQQPAGPLGNLVSLNQQQNDISVSLISPTMICSGKVRRGGFKQDNLKFLT